MLLVLSQSHRIPCVLFYIIKPGLRPNYTIIWVFIIQELNLEEVKLQRKLYLKLIESPVKPSSNLGAPSRNSFQVMWYPTPNICQYVYETDL